MSAITILCACVMLGVHPTEQPGPTALRFEVGIAPGLVSTPQDGRLLVVLGKSARPEPRIGIGRTGMNAPPLMGKDARGLTAGGTVVIDRNAVIFPIASLDALPKGKYFAQALLMTNRDLKVNDAPGNLFSEPTAVDLDPKAGGTVKLVLSKAVPEEKLPEATNGTKYVKLKSEILSRFHGRPIYLRAGIQLPTDFGQDINRRFPLRISIGGYGSRYSFMRRPDMVSKQMIVVMLDGARSYGDPNPGEFGQQRPLRRCHYSGTDSLYREGISRYRQTRRTLSRRHIHWRVGVAGLANLLSRLFWWLLVVLSRSGGFSLLSVDRHLRRRQCLRQQGGIRAIGNA